MGITNAAPLRTLERPFWSRDPPPRRWDLNARIAGLESMGVQVRGDPRERGERTWTVPTSSGLRLETTGMGDSARLDRFGRSASERRPEGLQGPFANALVPPGLFAAQAQGGEDPYLLCDGMEHQGAPSCAREAKVGAIANEVMTPQEMIDQALLSSATFDELSTDLGVAVTTLVEVGALLAGTRRLVDRSVAEGAGGTGGMGDPWSFEQAARILRQPIRAPGLEVLFKVDDVYDMKTFMKSDSSYPAPYTCTYLNTRHGMLLIRASGLEDQKILISSYRIDDEDDEAVTVGDGLARLLGCSACLPARSDADPACDEDGGVGISLENVEHIEISWLEIAGFSRGLEGTGHNRNHLLTRLDVHHNDRSGLRYEASPVLYSWKGGERCVDVCQVDGAIWPCAVLTEDRGYPDQIEITECLLHDNGLGKGSAGTQLHVAHYCTGFHIHRNLFFCTPDETHWGEEQVDGVPGVVTSIVNCVTNEGTTRNMRDEGATCKANLDKAAARVKDANHFWLKRWADAINAVEQTPGCHRSGGDGITMEKCSSGHIIEHNIFIGLQADCNHWQRPGGTVEDYGYQAPAGTWPTTPPIGPDSTCADGTTCGSNTSDGDGIDFKGLRPRTPSSKELTLVHENLFLFCEGPGILTHYGVLGLDIARNIFAGNGAGIVVSGSTTYLFHDDWTTTVTDANGQIYEFLEMGCFRIYRNLFLMNNRIDESCDRRGSGVGILIDISSRLAFGDNDPIVEGVEVNDACNYDEGDPRMHLAVRFRDFWIVNNTFHGHGEQAIWISRPEFEEGAEDPYSGITPQLPFLLQDFTLYNNIMSESFSGYDPQNPEDTDDLKGETSSTYAHMTFVVVADADTGTDPHFHEDWENPTLLVDHNLYFPVIWCPEDGQGGHECSLRWEWNANQWGVPKFMDYPAYREQHWLAGGNPTGDPSFIGAGRWDWRVDAWDAAWASDLSAAPWRGDLPGGTDVSMFGVGPAAFGYQSKWVSLPAAWNPWSYVPSTGSPALEQAKADTGVTDLGWYRRSGLLVDVGQGPDLFYRFKRSTVIWTRRCINGAWFVTEVTATPDADQGVTDLGALHLPLTQTVITDIGDCERGGNRDTTPPDPTTGPTDSVGQYCPDPFLFGASFTDLTAIVNKILEGGFWPANGVPCPMPFPEPDFLLSSSAQWWR